MSNSIKLTAEIQHLLLTIIDNDGDIDDLNRIGYDYFKIKNLIKEEISSGNATFTENQLRLSEKGKKYKNDLAKKLNYSDLEEIVSPKISAKIADKVDDGELFIPSEDELDF